MRRAEKRAEAEEMVEALLCANEVTCREEALQALSEGCAPGGC